MYKYICMYVYRGGIIKSICLVFLILNFMKNQMCQGNMLPLFNA